MAGGRVGWEGYGKIELDAAEILRSKQVSETLKSLEKK